MDTLAGEQYVVDEKGNVTAVILSIERYTANGHNLSFWTPPPTFPAGRVNIRKVRIMPFRSVI
jgi:hypothetical protein